MDYSVNFLELNPSPIADNITIKVLLSKVNCRGDSVAILWRIRRVPYNLTRQIKELKY